MRKIEASAGPRPPCLLRPDLRLGRTGLFIVLEGISGSGKSTLAALLADRLSLACTADG